MSYTHEYYWQKLRDVGRRCQRVIRDLRVVSLPPQGKPRGNVLLSYQLEPFTVDPQAVNKSHPVHWHSNNWESRQIANTFLDRGYTVDAIAWMNRAFRPRKKYDVVIDIRYNLQKWAPELPPDCLKIFHADSAHTLTRVAAESRRLLDVLHRRGVPLQLRRFEDPNRGIESCDCSTVIGNEYTLETYRYAGKPLFQVPVSSMLSMPFTEDKDYDACRRTFVWLGSGGMVSKGLDLTLEAFARMPDHQLIVCGAVNKEPDFEQAYYKELYQTPNIRTLGWTDVRSQAFAEVIRQSVGLIFPSCCEGQAGSVINCMSGGLIPIVSYESGVDVDDFGMILHESSIEEIRGAITQISSLPTEDLRAMSHGAWTRAVTRHSREAWRTHYRNLISNILELHHRGELAAQPSMEPVISGLGFNTELQKGCL